MTPTSESPPSARRIRVHLRVSEGQAGILASLFVWPGPFLGTDDDLDPAFLKLRVSQKTDMVPAVTQGFWSPTAHWWKPSSVTFSSCNLAGP